MHQLLLRESGQSTRLNGCVLLVAVGMLFGLSVPLSKLATEIGAQPIGLALWVNFLVGVSCLAITVLRRRLPVFNAQLFRFVFLWGLLGSVAGDVLLFWIVQKLPASTVSIVLVCEGFIVYGYMTVRGKGQSTKKNLSGLAFGMLGVVVLISNDPLLSSAGDPFWILLALTVPAVFAAEDFLISESMPVSVDFVALTGFAAIAGSVMILPVVWYLNDFVTLHWVPSQLEIAIVCIAASSALGTLFMVQLLTGMGAVYGSQSGYTITFAGVVWSIILLDERLNAGMLIALLLLIIGLIMVEPRKPLKAGTQEFA